MDDLISVIYEKTGVADRIRNSKNLGRVIYEEFIHKVKIEDIESTLSRAEYAFIKDYSTDNENLMKVVKEISEESRIEEVLNNIRDKLTYICISICDLDISAATSEMDYLDKLYDDEFPDIERKYKMLLKYLDWNKISRNENIPEEFVREFIKYLDMRIVLLNNRFSDNYVEYLYDNYPELRTLLEETQHINF